MLSQALLEPIQRIFPLSFHNCEYLPFFALSMQHCCNWVSSSEPLDTPLDSMLPDCPRVSAGIDQTISTPPTLITSGNIYLLRKRRLLSFCKCNYGSKNVPLDLNLTWLILRILDYNVLLQYFVGQNLTCWQFSPCQCQLRVSCKGENKFWIDIYFVIFHIAVTEGTTLHLYPLVEPVLELCLKYDFWP